MSRVLLETPTLATRRRSCSRPSARWTRTTRATSTAGVRNLMTTHGERFSPEEIEDFLNFAVDADTGLLHYEDYVSSVCPY